MFDNFDPYARDYRSVHTQNIKISGVDSYYFAEHKVKYIAKYETDQNIEILDFGCGDGAVDLYINKYFPAAKIEGVDISRESVEIATSHNIPNTNYSVFNGLELDFPHGTFDVVILASVLHHVDKSKHIAVLTEIRRVLKPGGRLYIFEHNPYNPVTKHIVRTCIFDKDACLLTPSYAGKILKQSNFEMTRKSFVLFFPRNKYFKFLLPLEKWLVKIPLGAQYFTRACK